MRKIEANSQENKWEEYLQNTFPKSPIERYYINHKVELVFDPNNPTNLFLTGENGREEIPEIRIKQINQYAQRPFLDSKNLPVHEGIHIPQLGCLVRPPSNQLIPDDQWGLRKLLLNMTDEPRQTLNDCFHRSLHIAHYNVRFQGNIEYEDNIREIYLLLIERILFEEPYTKDGKLKERRSEIHESTGQPKTQFEHIILVGKNANCNFYQYIKNGTSKETINNLNLTEDVLGKKEVSFILHLGGFFHDAKEDFTGSSQEIEKTIKTILKEYDFMYLEKYLIPLVRMMTHDKKEKISMYISQMENPNEKLFCGYSLSEPEKESIKTLSIHIKCMGDLAHNWQTQQTQKAICKKIPPYSKLIKKYYPDYLDFLDIHPSVKYNLERLEQTERTNKEFKPDLRKHNIKPLNLVIHTDSY